jgi:hypothetical protein
MARPCLRLEPLQPRDLPSFIAPVSYAPGSPFGTRPTSVAVGDFNGDGALDVVTGDTLGPHAGVSVYLGHGDGTFQAARFQESGRPVAVAVGDFNNDGRLDVVTGNAAADGATTVTPAAADHFQVDGPGTAASGSPFDVTVTALDPFGNTDTNYAGTVTWTTSDVDPGVVVPADYAFTSGAGADNGVHTFAGAVILVTPGDQTLTATDTVSGITGGTTVTVTAAGGGPAAPAGRPKVTVAAARAASPRPPVGIPPTPTAGNVSQDRPSAQGTDGAAADAFFAAEGPGGPARSPARMPIRIARQLDDWFLQESGEPAWLQ